MAEHQALLFLPDALRDAGLPFGDKEHVIGGIEIINNGLAWLVTPPATASPNSLQGLLREVCEYCQPLKMVLRLFDVRLHHGHRQGLRRAEQKKNISAARTQRIFYNYRRSRTTEIHTPALRDQLRASARCNTLT